MLRITESESSATEVTLKLEGRIIGEWAAELQQICESYLSQRRSLTLDMEGVIFADALGIPVLQGLKGRDVRVRNCSPFLSRLLTQMNG